MATKIEVIAYCGYRGEQEPRAVILEGERLDVLGITDQWLDPQARYFKVHTSDGHLHLLRCDLESSSWTLVKSFWLDS